MNKDFFNLIGFSNLLNIDCGFLFPIFSNGSKLYFQDSENNYITEFFEADEERVTQCFYPINGGAVKKGSPAVISFLLSKVPLNYIHGSAVEVRNSLEKYIPFVKNDIIKNDIISYIEETDIIRKSQAIIPADINNFRTVEIFLSEYKTDKITKRFLPSVTDIEEIYKYCSPRIDIVNNSIPNVFDGVLNLSDLYLQVPEEKDRVDNLAGGVL